MPWTAVCSAEETVNPPGDPGEFHLYLLMGQSNMAGRGAVSEDVVAPERVLKLTAEMKWAPASDPIHFDKPQIAGAGPGSGFGPAMAEADEGVTIGLIPCAFGGTPLSRWVKGGDLYENAVKRTRAAAKQGTLKGVIWHQGESDSGEEELAETYAERLYGMIGDLRDDLKLPDLPVVVGELGEFLQTERYPYAGAVNRALEELPEQVSNTAFVDAEGLTAKSDEVHFDAESCREFGRRYARAMLDL